MDAKRLLGAIVRLIPMLLVVACAAGEGGKRGSPVTSSPDAARTLYVAASSDCGGESPCFGRIQDAVDAAADGAVIKVAAGVYTSTEEQVLYVDKAVQLIGGYGAADWLQSTTSSSQRAVLDAEEVPGRRGIYVDGTDALTITIVGFQVQRGYAEQSSGGGIFVAGGSVVLEGNSVLSSTAEASGGGLFVSAGQVALRRNVIRANSARYGGGLYVDGGQVSLESDVFTDNEARPVGGAIAIGGGNVSGHNVTVVQNPMAEAGVYLCGGHLAASHWTLVDNGHYGLIADLGIEIDSGSASLRNSIVASHTTGLCGAGAAAHQTLFHDVRNPCIAGASCVSNLFGDPAFTDPLHADYHIRRESAAVDQALGTAIPTDMDGESRPLGTASDIGADEVDPVQNIYLPMVVRQSP